MKKNPAMRAASVLLVGTLLSTSMVSGTFAKYVTTNEAEDSARVAKWGVLIQAHGSLYGDEYSEAVDNKPIVYSNKTNTGTVQAVDEGNDLVAPGTKNDTGFDISLTGIPEVDTKIDATIKARNIFLKSGSYAIIEKTDGITEENFADLTATENGAAAKVYVESEGKFTAVSSSSTYDSEATYYTVLDSVELANDYYPVIYKTTNKDEGTYNADSLQAIAGAYAEKLNGAAVTGSTEDDTATTTYTIEGKIYQANTDLAEAIKLDDETLTWEWAFERKNGEDVIADYDTADTILGDLITAGTDGKIDNKDAYVINTDSGTILTPDKEGLVKSGTDTVACLKTSFSISITATQVD